MVTSNRVAEYPLYFFELREIKVRAKIFIDLLLRVPIEVEGWEFCLIDGAVVVERNVEVVGCI